jgi:sugar/nucleoside kinase (ribokinase family)
MSQELVTDEMLKRCKAVHVGGTFLLPGMDGEGAARLFERARAFGCHTSMDVTWDTTGRWDSLISPCYPHLDLFMPSFNEAKHIAGTDDPEAVADYFLGRGVKTAVVKLGARGCFVKNAEQSFFGGVYAVKPVDTTGAGDAFTAGFLHAKLNGLGLEQCARWGAAVAARAILLVGATDGVPGEKELQDWMEKADYKLS